MTIIMISNNNSNNSNIVISKVDLQAEQHHRERKNETDKQA